MSRRKAFIRPVADRIPSEIASPNETRRLRDAAMAGLRDSCWGSEVGRLHMAGKLTSAELSTANYWATLCRAYSTATRSPSPPHSIAFEIGRAGMATDPNSEAGVIEAKRHLRTTTAWIEGRDALRKCGRYVENIVDEIVIRDLARTGYDEIAALKAGLAALSAQWSSKRKASGPRP